MNAEKKAAALHDVAHIMSTRELTYPELLEVLGEATATAAKAMSVSYDLKRKSPEDFASSLGDMLKEMLHG